MPMVQGIYDTQEGLEIMFVTSSLKDLPSQLLQITNSDIFIPDLYIKEAILLNNLSENLIG